MEATPYPGHSPSSTEAVLAVQVIQLQRQNRRLLLHSLETQPNTQQTGMPDETQPNPIDAEELSAILTDALGEWRATGDPNATLGRLLQELVEMLYGPSNHQRAA